MWTVLFAITAVVAIAVTWAAIWMEPASRRIR